MCSEDHDVVVVESWLVDWMLFGRDSGRLVSSAKSIAGEERLIAAAVFFPEERPRRLGLFQPATKEDAGVGKRAFVPKTPVSTTLNAGGAVTRQ